MTTRRITPKLTIGLDLGDRFTHLCALDARGQIVTTERLRTTPAALEGALAALPRCRVVLEVGTHSPWVSRLLERLGHEVLVANARQLRLIYGGDRKCDRVEAETLGRLGRLDPALLKPIRHRGAGRPGRSGPAAGPGCPGPDPHPPHQSRARTCAGR
jgi:transposase